MRTICLFSAVVSFLGVSSLVGAVSYKPNEERANAVKQAFRISWDGYYKGAFPNDTFLPVKGSHKNDRNGWGASAVDALSTALVMGEQDIVSSILDFVPTINFNSTSTEISLFETTIRYLGGLLSAYDLMTEGKLGPANSSARAVLDQAEQLATNLKIAFDTPSGVPVNHIYFDPPRRKADKTNGLATIGTLVLEWTRLSDLTGNPVFGELAQKAESYLLDPKPLPRAEPFPGMVGGEVDVTTGLFVNGDGGWGGGTDSFYEYLIKMYLYDPNRFASYKDRWTLAVDSTMANLTSHPTTRPDLTFLALYDDQKREYTSEHLACFAGGNFILGGLTLDKPQYTEFGLNITRSCRETYLQTKTGIGPEIFHWQDASEPADAPTNPGPPANDSELVEFYKRAGFWIGRDPKVNEAAYVLRPEVIESIYYAYRATGDPIYQDWAWEAFLNINRTCHVATAYSSIKNVNIADGDGFNDGQESFWFAETLKYSYLIHAEDADWQVKADKSNKWVFNTEAHPVRVAGRAG